MHQGILLAGGLALGAAISIVGSMGPMGWILWALCLMLLVVLVRRRPGDGLAAAGADLLAHVSDAVVAVDERGTITAWNPAAEAMYGWRARDVIGRPGSEVLGADDGDAGAAELSALCATGHWSGTVAQRQRDGTRLRVEAKAIALRDGAGRIKGFVTVNRDVTAREEAARALQRSEERYRSLLDVAQSISGTLERGELLRRVQRQVASALRCDAVLTIQRDPLTGRFRIAAHHGIVGRVSPEELALETMRETRLGRFLMTKRTLVVNDVRELSEDSSRLVDALGLGALMVAPLRVRGRHYGALVVGRARPARQFLAGDVDLCLAIARQLGVAMEDVDLYQARQDEADVAGALARVGRELISALNAPGLLDRVCQVTADVLQCDVTFTLLWQPEEGAYVVAAGHGFSEEDWESLRLLRMPWDGLSGLIAALGRDGAVRSDMAAASTRLAALPSRYGLATVLYVPLRRGEEIIGVLGAGFRRAASFAGVRERIARGLADVASLALEDARLCDGLERAERLKGDFVATMSHELRTPMNIILGYNELLLDEAFGALNAEQVEALRAVDDSARHLLELIDETLDLSRLEAGRLTLELSEVDVQSLMRELRGETARLQEKPGIAFEWAVAPDLPLVHTDAGKLKSVVKHLLDNAVKFTEQGRVRVEVLARDGGVEVRVSDTGIGIPRDTLPIVFEPFRQLESTVTQTRGGIGLGLYLVHRLVDLLGGRIAVDSEPGEGSTFRTWFPDLAQRDDRCRTLAPEESRRRVA